MADGEIRNKRGGTSYSALRLLDALTKAESNGWYIPSGWHNLTDEQRGEWADDVLDNDGRITNNLEDK
jgi:hypothetical protein